MSVERGERGPTGDHGQTGDTGKTGARGRRGSSLPGLAGPVAWVILVTVITAVLVLQGCQIRENSKTHDALCAFRHDLELRVENTNKLLKENPGPTIFTIPRAVIITSRNNQQNTIDSLSNLDCS